MRLKLTLLATFMAMAASLVSAQSGTTLVTAQVQDTTGKLYGNCQWSVVFVGENTTPGAGPYAPDSLLRGQQGTCDSFGNISVNLADNINTVTPLPSQWAFSICSVSGLVGGPFCKVNMLITITGATQNLTSFFTPQMPLLPGGGGGGGIPGGTDTYVQFNQLGTFGGSNNFVFNYGSNALTLTGSFILNGPTPYIDWLGVPALSNPPAGYCRQQFNSNTGLETWTNSSGTSCGPSGSGGGITGSGTTNSIPKWTTPTSLGNSGLADNGTSVTTTENIQVFGVNANSFFSASPTSTCPTGGSPPFVNGFAGCSGLSGTLSPAAGTTGLVAGIQGNVTPGVTLSSTPWLTGVFGSTVLSASGSPSWIGGIVGVSETNGGSGTVAVSSGVFGLGAVGIGSGSGGQTATILEGVGGRVAELGAAMTNPQSATFYAHSPIFTGKSNAHYGLFMEDQTTGGANNPNPHAVWTIGAAPSQFGGALTVLGNLTTNVTGSSQCLQVNSGGTIGGSGAPCGGSAGFPSGTGVVTVVGGSSYGATLSETGTGNAVLSNNATMVAPILGTPTSVTLTNATGLPLATGVTGTVQIANLGASGTPSSTTFLRGDNAWATPAGSGNVSGPGSSTTHGIASYADTTGTLLESNTLLATNVTSQTSNGAANQVCTYTGANKICVPGAVTNAMLSNAATTVNGQTCTLGSTCTIPEQVNTVSLTSTAGFNLLTSTVNAVGLTVTPVNSATNAIKFEITGGTYTGNAAGLFGSPSITINALTATTINGATLAGTFPGTFTFSGNPNFTGSPVFAMTGGPFCVQETAGVLSSTGVACGGGGSISGTPNYVAVYNGSGTGLTSVGSVVSGQLLVFQNGTAPIASSPSLVDSGSSPT